MEQSESELDCLSPEEPDNYSDSDFEPNMKTSKRKQASSLGTISPKRRRRQEGSSTSSSVTPISSIPVTAKHTQPDQPDKEGAARRKTGCMYEAVKSGSSALVTVVDDWLEEYKQERKNGLLELLNFVVEVCGCKGVVSKEMFENLQNADIISYLTKEFNEDSVNYPLAVTGVQGRRFRDNMCEYVRHLVQRCRNSLLYDEYVFSALIAFLTGLADSQVRAFRHTSTFIAMRLMSAVVALSAEVYAQAETTLRRCELEKNKSPPHRATERLEELQMLHNELLEQQEELRSLMNGIFKGVFVHRYRDKVPDIRAICMEELGVWLRDNPTSFLNDKYLKYLGWMLHDKQASVRLQCVLALQKLYKEKNFIGRLELFTSRFKERLLNMLLDKDADVAVEAVRLLLLIKQETEEGLTEEECMRVYPLVFATHRGLASAAGAFLYHVLCTEVDTVLEVEEEKRSIVFLNLLTCFFIQSKFHEHAAYLVDSLWGVAGAELKDWETMTLLLLQDNEEERGLNDFEEAALIELMLCAVRQAAEGTPPVARSSGKKGVNKKQQLQERKRITNFFIPLLPQLLTKFSADVDKVMCLLKAPLYFDLDSYGSTGRLEKYLELLLNQVCEIVKKHHEECVLEECVRVLCLLCCDRYTFSVRAETVVSQLLDSIQERLNTHMDDILQGTADEDDLYSAITSLRRLTVFSGARDLTTLKLFEPCFLLLKTGVESREVDAELMVCAIKCATFYLMWRKVKISQTAQLDKVEVKKLLKEVNSFFVVCQSCLSLNLRVIRDQAFVCVCDLLVIFGQSGDGIAELKLSPDDTLRAEMASFLIDYIFAEPEYENAGEDEEEMIVALQHRRNQLAGYCKLIIYGVFEIRAAADIFKYYSKFYRDYGDIIKETLSKSKMMSAVESARTIGLTLQQMYSSLSDKHHAEELQEIRDLAKRLAMSFGVNLKHIRKPLLTLHQDGIQFALRGTYEGDHTNLGFLEILCEFSHKLIKEDKTQLLSYLQRVCEHVHVSMTNVSMYKRSLHPRSRGTPAVTSQQTPAKRRHTAEEMSSSFNTPALTSTVLQSQASPIRPSSPSQASELSSDQLSETDFSEGLSLIEEDLEEEEVVDSEIEEFLDDDYDDEMDGAVSLPSTRHSTSALEELFE